MLEVVSPTLTPLPGTSVNLTVAGTSPAVVAATARAEIVTPLPTVDVIFPGTIRFVRLTSPVVVAAPDDTTRFTELPDATLVPAVGFWLMTLPDATVELLCVVTVPTLRPAPVIAVEAAAWVMPTTLGTETVTGAGPDDTTRFTELPDATLVPEAGF